ncbi:5'-flap endonuclease [Fusarium equiseti]|uniref:Structure-specific endonuclease subunit SLX4 n=1 Tax=Fusarium equiseti TaxID=61235 RepID=A0ABQ8RKV0_FUSEQ|nr:5'-flap endonuclease [Fusarium equiseti]
MASSDPSRLSPLSDRNRQPLHVNSSSPDLPSLRDVLSRKSSSQHQTHNETPGFVSARHLYSSTESTTKANAVPLVETSLTAVNLSTFADPADEPPADGGFIAGDPTPKQPEEDIVVVKITGKGTRKPRQPKVSKPAAPKRAKAKPAAKAGSSKDDDDGKDVDDTQVKPKATKPRKKRTGTMSSHFPPVEEPGEPEKLDQIDVNEPLHLEQASARRLDWTPPAQKTVVNLDSDSSAFKTLGSSEAGQPLPIFKNLVGGYARIEDPSESASHSAPPSDEDSSFLKKRKRIELLATKGANSSVTEPEKSPTKKPPKKKKPRTITELATAAYRVPSQPDPQPSASILDHFSTTKNDTGSAADAQPDNAKGKAKPRRKTTKAPKKKVPPKPILLSPGAALAQVANQDFLFGTSSQLAREESPTVLRDLQTALRQSNQNDDIDFAMPIHSDGIEPQQQRTNLWNAAARDAEGDLFDVEVINLIEDTTLLQEDDTNSNPFGYNIGADQSVIEIESHVPNDPDHSVELPEPAALPGERAMSASEGDSPYFSDSDLSVSTNIGPLVPGQDRVADENLTEEAENLPELPPQPPRPNYEGFTDLRLAREIKKFGFKPIKRRSAMISLLDQCWQSKARLGQASFHTTAHATAKSPSAKSKTPKTTKPKASPKTTRSPKKATKQTRRNSPSASEPQEPPPSAQPPVTPKRRSGRPRKDSFDSSSGTDSPSKRGPGRPRKDSLDSSPRTPSPSKRKPASPSKRSTSPRHGKTSQTSVIEIPDSEDDASNFASSPQTNLEQPFSSEIPLDMSLTTNEDAETDLTATPTDAEAALFEHITNAVKSAPRTTNPQEPSWNEKILLYEPLVLEDLAMWLNTGELSRVGFDGEVNPADVKKWCESKSVCCVARVSLRGKERKRF